MDILFGKVRIKVDEDYDGTSATITTEKGFSQTVALHTPSVDVILAGLEEYTIEYQNGYKDTFTLGYGNMVISTAGGILLPFSTCTDEQLARMVELFYEDVFTLDDIKSVWSVGDRRTVHLSDMPAESGCAAHSAQDIEIQILDFEYHELVSPINGHTKALLTCDQVDALKDADYQETSTFNNWPTGATARQQWLDKSYYTAFPDGIRALIKRANRKVNHLNSSFFAANPPFTGYAFLLSLNEATGASGWGTVPGLKYYEATAHRLKGAGYKRTAHTSYPWWLVNRQMDSGNIYAYRIETDGSYARPRWNDTLGLAPAICM